MSESLHRKGRATTGTARGAERESAEHVRHYHPLLDVIRVLAVVGVVSVHVIADHMTPGSPTALLVVRSLLATAVPAFVMMSGALNLAPAAMRRGSSDFLSRRLRRLLPAAVVWTAFYALVMNSLVAPEPTTWRGELAKVLTASTYPHLYFLPLILGLTVLTPVLSAFLTDSSRRAWALGTLAATWAMGVSAIPYVSDALLGKPVVPLEVGALTYFLPFIGYYVLGRAAWSAPPSRRTAWWLLTAGVPLLTAATIWAYSSPFTQDPPGRALLPTYLSPTVMLLSLALVIPLMALGKSWRVRERSEALLRSAGDATFGVFLVHFAVLVALRMLSFPESSMYSVCALIVVVTVASFGLALLGKRVPGLRRAL